MNIRKIQKSYNCILIVFLILCSTFLFSNKMLVKEKTKNNVKALDQEGQNYRLVTSADDVQVPVPKGYVASQVTGENYVTPEYQHNPISHKGNYTELTWSSPAGEQYPWTQDENGIWISGNQGIPDSTSVLESEEFDYIKGTTLTINYTYSTKYPDYLYFFLIDLTNNITNTLFGVSGGNTTSGFDYTTSNYVYTMNDWGTGRYKLRAIYNKNNSGDGGQDSAYIKPSTYFKKDENGTEIFEEDIKTRIHDGGFVIYQLTDEELETNPNGTSVIINDINKDDAQSTRNQYVWVPVENIEDILYTRATYNGIMQFGQSYRFDKTSITKSTGIGNPSLVEQYDKTKYYLQRYSKIKKRENFLNNMQEDFAKMIESVNKYKGFYIGRYETACKSNLYGTFIEPKIVRYALHINKITWYESCKDLERLSGKTEKYVETGVIYGSLFDYTLKWLNDTDTRSYADIKIDSGTWGNYSNNSLKYKSSANGTEYIIDASSSDFTPTGGVTEITYHGETYSDSPTSSNNIFDMAGGVKEWTKSKYNQEYRSTRGGDYSYSSSGYPASSNANEYSIFIGYKIGVRAELFIK